MSKSKNVQNTTKAGNEVLTNFMPYFSDWDFVYEFEMWHRELDRPEYDMICPHREWEKKAYIAGCKRMLALLNKT